MTLADAVARLEGTTGRVASFAATSDLETPVERLGRWRARDVVAHLGGVHEWAARIVRTGSMDGPGFRKSKLRGEALAAWYAEAAAELVEVLRAAEPEASCPNFNPGSPPTNAFWIRRQLHEALVHAYDLERVLDRPAIIPPEVAADGVDEYLDVFVRTRGKQTLSAPLHLAATDADAAWVVAPAAKPGRVTIDADDVEPVATMRGPAMDLLLVAWNRLTVPETALEITGDEAVAASFRG